MNLKYVEQALCFHGAPMQKIWDNERGADDLQQLGIPVQPNYDIYQQRQRFFTFQDRAKRLKLHQFFARKALDLYDNDLQKYANVPDEKYLEKAKTSFAIIPPYEVFAYDPNDKDRKWHAVLESLKPGDNVYGMFSKTTNPSPTYITFYKVKPLCTVAPVVRYLNHLPLRGIVAPQDCNAVPLDKDGKPRGYLPNDIVRCEVLRTSIEVDRVFLGLNGVYNTDSNVKLGLVELEDLPLYYKNAKKCESTYDQSLRDSKEFLNPNYEVLYRVNGLDINDTFSMMGALKLPFPQYEMSKELRKAQAHKWAFRSVAEGIELFKNGHHFEAFQCLNKALSIDPYNVEGLVARGALFANRGSFHKAVDDFGNALKLDKFHANARKYMGETLVALGRSLEEDKRLDEAAKAYKDCLVLIPNHVQAMGCLEALNQRLTGSLLDNSFFDNLLNIPATGTLKSQPNDELMANVDSVKRPNSTSSEDSSSDSDSSDSEGDATSKAASSKLPKAASLSPLSKRMALHAASMREFDFGNAAAMNEAPPPPSMNTIRYDQPFFVTRTVTDADDFRLDDDDTQVRVMKLIEQASAHKKNKKKKTKKNKSQKSKKASKKNKAENKDDSSNLQESLFQSNYLLETFKNIGSQDFQQKLSKDINSYEYKIAEIQKRQEMLRHSMNTGDESPPPPPSMNLTAAHTSKMFASFSKEINKTAKGVTTKSFTTPTTSSASSAAAAAAVDANRFSFQIKKPVKVDKFGLVRIATPLKQRSPSLTRDADHRESRRRSKSGTRSRTRSPHRRSSGSRSRRSRSSSYKRRNRRRKSRSNSNYRDSRSRRRDSRSPYLRRRSRSRSRSNDRKRKHWDNNRTVSRATRSPSFQSKSNFGNRVWQRAGYAPPPPPKGSGNGSKGSDQRWEHDKFEEINSDPITTTGKKEEGPSIEEIDEIINKAQKERKAEIIKRDKELLKRPNKGQF